MRNLLILFFLSVGIFGYAQNGKIRGTVFDNATGETLVGVTIVVKGTTNGTTTDLDGKFSLDLPEGSYNLQISFISYQAILLENIQVKPKEVTVFDNLRLNESAVELGEVVVTAKAVRTNETALQTIKMKSAVMLDGISSTKIQQIGWNCR